MSTIAEAHAEVTAISNNEDTAEGWTIDAYDIGPAGAMAAVVARKDFRGNGGDYYFYRELTTGATQNSLNLDRNAEEGFARIAFLRMASSGGGSIEIGGLGTGEAIQNSWIMTLSGVTGDTDITTNGTLRVTSASSIPRNDSLWSVFEIWWRNSTSGSGDTDGHVIVYKDFNYTTPWVSYTGDVHNPLATSDGRDTNQLEFDIGGRVALTDIKVQDITIEFDTGAGGTLSVGDTVRFETGGASVLGRAEVTAIIGDNTAGRLQLRDVRDSGATDWDGQIANSPLATSATIYRDAGGWSANATNGDLDIDSGLPENGYFAVARTPQTLNVGASTPLSYTGGVDNVDSVDDGVGSDSESNYVYTSTSTDNDIYDFGTVVPAAIDVSAIKGVTVYARIRKDGTGLDNYRLQSKEGANATIDGELTGSPADWNVVHQRYPLNPRTGLAWDHTAVTDTDFGIKFES